MPDTRRYLTIWISAALFLIVVGLGCAEWIGRATGTTLSPRDVAKLQTDNPRTVVYDERIPTWGPYKVQRASFVQPDVVFIGSSRAMAFRSEMLAPYKFYNESLTAWTIYQTRQVLARTISVSSPKVALITLDYWMFANSWSAIEATRSMEFKSWPARKLKSVGKLLRTLVSYPGALPIVYPLLAAKLGMNAHSNHNFRDNLNFLGIDGMIHQVGFRSDGSFLQPAHYRALANDDDKNFMSNVLHAFPGGRRYDQAQMDELTRLSSYAKSRGVTLIAIQLPVSKSATDYLDTSKDYRVQAGLWRESQTEERQNLLGEIGLPFINLARMKNLDNTDFIDAAHLTEKGSMKVLLELAKHPEFQKALPNLDVAKIAADLAAITDQEAMAVYPTE